MIFVDPTFKWPGPRGYRHWCHMGTNDHSPEGIDALHAFARKVGMRREWFQDKASHPHYDLVPSRRAKAVELGAIELLSTPVYSLVCGTIGYLARLAEANSVAEAAAHVGREADEKFIAGLAKQRAHEAKRLDILNDAEREQVIKYAVLPKRPGMLFQA